MDSDQWRFVTKVESQFVCCPAEFHANHQTEAAEKRYGRVWREVSMILAMFDDDEL